ncbi:MAG: cupin domain-containing protein [Trueperaceae bacterium]
MKVVDIASLRPPSGGSPRFEGGNYGANVSFFVVTSSPGNGADKHRHPYEETFVILEGDIEVIIDGELRMIQGSNIVVIPLNTWHEFKNRSSHNALMINIHPVPKMIQEDWT